MVCEINTTALDSFQGPNCLNVAIPKFHTRLTLCMKVCEQSQIVFMFLSLFLLLKKVFPPQIGASPESIILS